MLKYLPIVFLHDGFVHRLGFDAPFKAFSKNYAVIRYDRPGYGDSNPPGISYSEVETLKGLFDFPEVFASRFADFKLVPSNRVLSSHPSVLTRVLGDG